MYSRCDPYRSKREAFACTTHQLLYDDLFIHELLGPSVSMLFGLVLGLGVREEFFQRRGAEVCIVGATRTEVSERLSYVLLISYYTMIYLYTNCWAQAYQCCLVAHV